MAAEADNTVVKSVAIILAAGPSSRMKQSKQLLIIGNETLLRKTVRTVIDSGVDKVLIVLGYGQQAHQQEIIDLPIQTIYNQDLQKGMGSSLKIGVRFVEENFPICETLIISVCDQPLLTSDHLKRLINAHQAKGSPIVASFYSDSPGVTGMFDHSMFKKLLEVNDEHGAKKIIEDHSDSASFVEFPEGVIDIDTPDDWSKFNKR